MKSITVILVIFIFMSPVFSNTLEVSKDINVLWAKSRTLYKEGKFELYFKVLDQGLLEYPKYRLDILKSKYYVFVELKQFKNALQVVLKIDKLDTKKLRSTCLNIAHLYIKLNDSDNAIKWIKESIDRGYQYFQSFEKDDIYKSIKNDKRFKVLINQIKSNIGINKPVKNFEGLTLSGVKISLADYKGKVILIDFWATWCPSCVKSMPELKEYKKIFKADEFSIIGINLDKNKNKVIDFLKKNKTNWPNIFSGKAFQDNIVKLFKINEIPSTWLIDKKGVLRYFGLSGLELKNKIAELVKE